MSTSTENPVDYFKRKFLEASLLIMTALGLALILGIMAEIVGLFLPELDLKWRWLLLTVFVTASIGLGLWAFHLLVPPLALEKRAICRLLLNLRTGEFLPSVYYSFYDSQSFIEQAFRVMRDRQPLISEEIRQGLSARLGGRNIYDHCIEYLIYTWLRRDLIWSLSHGIPYETLEYRDFPEQLKQNVFLQSFSTLEPKDVVERGLSQVELQVPDSMNLVCIDNRQILLKGGCCQLLVSYRIGTPWPVQHMYISPGEPRLLETPINPFYLENLEAKLGELATVDFLLLFEAKFPNSRFRYLLNRKRIEEYMAWATTLALGFSRFFDFENLRDRAVSQTQRQLFDAVKSMDSKIDRLLEHRSCQTS